MRNELWKEGQSYAKIYNYLHDYVGASKRQSLMNDLCDFLYFEKAEWALVRRRKFSPEVCLVIVSEPITGEILDLGGSLPSDLFVDNFGTWLAALIRSPVNASTAFTMTNTAAASKTMNALHQGSNLSCFNYSSSATPTVGTQIQIGSSTTAPARADLNIGTAFGTAPESALFSTGTGSYNAGTITISGSITSGGTGTINEALFAGKWVDSTLVATTTATTFCLIHDATTATAFTAGKSITVQFSITD